MINAYVSEQLITELEAIFDAQRKVVPTYKEIQDGITIQEVAYWAGVRDVIETLRFASRQDNTNIQIL